MGICEALPEQTAEPFSSHLLPLPSSQPKHNFINSRDLSPDPKQTETCRTRKIGKLQHSNEMIHYSGESRLGRGIRASSISSPSVFHFFKEIPSFGVPYLVHQFPTPSETGKREEKNGRRSFGYGSESETPNPTFHFQPNVI